MEIVFENKTLEELYENGKARKIKLPQDIVAKYIRTIDKLRAASCIEELFPFKSLNYEKLKGDKKGLESVRVDLKYRIEFRSSLSGEPPNQITICSIVALSNHYQ